MTTPTRVWTNTLAKANQWLAELGEELGCDNEPLNLFVLRSVLHVLRDHLPADEALRLSFRMPVIIRGVYVEGWRPAEAVTVVTRQEFLTLVAQRLQRSGLGREAETITRAVFKLIAHRLSAEETAHLRRVLPADLADLWPGAVPRPLTITTGGPGPSAFRNRGEAGVSR